MRELINGLYTLFNSQVEGHSALYNTLADDDDSITYPFVVMSIIDNVKAEAPFGETWEEYLIQFAIYSDDSQCEDAVDIYESIKTALDENDSALTVSGYRVNWLDRTGAANLIRIEDEGKLIWQLTCQYTVQVEKN